MAIVKLGNGTLSVGVDLRGAELASIQTADGAEWLWQGDPAIWTGRAPILFPIVGRTPGGILSIGGRKFAMGTHGFARGSDFVLAEASPEMVRLRLIDSEATQKQYPFAFVFDLVFAVEGETLVIRAEVRNTGEARMPFSLGFHPAFRWPLPGGEGRPHFVTLAEPEEPLTSRLGEKLMTAPGHEPSVFREGRYAPKADDFTRDAIIIDALESRSATFGVDRRPRVVVAFADFPSLGIWQKPGAAYLCVEPWQGMTPLVGASDAIEKRPGIVWLDPGEMRSFTMTVTPLQGE
ncbi:MAG TPA: aldose 1-epimerase family protein [Bauldia sp.]